MSFPTQIRVSGLPFMLQGWNNTYRSTSMTTDECPIYRLDSYRLYGLIPIIGVTIFRKNGVWMLQRDGDFCPTDIMKYGAGPQPDPFGYWSGGAYVTPC